MSTTVGTVISQMAEMLQEDGSYRGSTDWANGLWTPDEIIKDINIACKQFVLDTQLIKVIAPIASVTGQRSYADPAFTMQIDRIAFNDKSMYRTTRLSLDRENYLWRTLSGLPRQYHQDQLSTKTFEVDRAPTSGMTGLGYTASGLYGTLRQMSGSYTYVGVIPATGRGGIFRYAYGARAYTGVLPSGRPYQGTLRQMQTGLTNFVVLATRLMDDVQRQSDLMRVPDFVLMYIRFYVMAMMLAKEGEGQDLPRAKYCLARYNFGVELFKRLLGAAHDQIVAPQGASV